MKKLLLYFVLWMSIPVLAQDTITVMQYNLLYYGEITSFCTSSNNGIQTKDPYFRTIIEHVKPDIFTVNELSSNTSIHQHILDNILNINEVDYFQKATSTNNSGSNIVNMLYFDSRKLALKKQSVAQSSVRDINVYELYYKSNDLADGDTAFIVCVVAHLKAGNSSADATTRNSMVVSTMQYLEPRYSLENILFMGDFNFYNGNEAGFQTMINYANTNMRFIDPINQIGAWNNNAAFASVHTQSTSTSGDCKAGGGMDDRFDFILISDELQSGTKNVKYIPASYKAVGQDGQRFNGTVNGLPQNTAVNQEVAEALFNFSDHLPVTLQLEVSKLLDLNEQLSKPFLAEISPNPAVNEVKLRFYMPVAENVKIEITAVSGTQMIAINQFFGSGKQELFVNLTELPSGFYFVRLIGTNNRSETLKLVRIP